MDHRYEVMDFSSYPGLRVRTSDYDYMELTASGFERFLTLTAEPDPWEYYDEELRYVAFISAEEAGDTIVVTNRALENYATQFCPEAVDTKTVIVVDADTLELQTLMTVAILPDGSEQTCYEMTQEWDVEPFHPEVIEAIEKHLYEEEHETRTTTLIFDDDKPCKRSITYETPMGDGCRIDKYVGQGWEYEVDFERGVPSTKARDNDAVYYLVRVESGE